MQASQASKLLPGGKMDSDVYSYHHHLRPCPFRSQETGEPNGASSRLASEASGHPGYKSADSGNVPSNKESRSATDAAHEILQRSIPEPNTQNKDEKNTCLPEKSILAGSLTAAAAGAGLFGAHWALDKIYSELPVEKQSGMKWWQAHSHMVKNQDALRLSLSEAIETNAKVSEALSANHSKLASAKASVKAITESVDKQLAANPYGEKTRAILEEQKNFAQKSLNDKIRMKEIDAKIGSADEIFQSGGKNKLFQNDSQQAKWAREFRRQTHLDNMEPSLDRKVEAKLARQSLLNDVRQKLKIQKQFGNISASDFKLLQNQQSSLAKVAAGNADLIPELIGNSAELSGGQKFFLNGSREAKTLLDYAESMGQQNQLLSQLEASSDLVTKRSDRLLSCVSKGPGSLGTALGKGALLSGGGMLLGYGLDSALSSTLGYNPEMTDGKLLVDAAVVPGIMYANCLPMRLRVPLAGATMLFTHLAEAASKVDLANSFNKFMRPN